MNHFYSMNGEKVILRPLEAGDLERMRILRNQNRHFFVSSDEITEEAQRRWYETYLTRENDYLFSIFYQEHWVGAVSLYEVDQNSGQAEFGRLMIDRKAAGVGGLGVDAARTACKIAFEQMNIQTVTLEVYADNVAAQITYLKAGFVPEEMVCNETGKKMVQMRCVRSRKEVEICDPGEVKYDE